MGSRSRKKSKGDPPYPPCSLKCSYSDHDHDHSSDADQPDLPSVSSGSQDSSPRTTHHRSRDSDDSSGNEDDRSSSLKKNKKVSDEEIAKYLAKKAQKKAMKVAKKLKNESNLFGDSNLTEKFVWRKKIERDVTRGVPPDMFSLKADQKKMQKERMAEIEKVKNRREERAMGKAQHEEEMALLDRERARAEFQDWEKKGEEQFHFHQSKARSDIRLREEFNHDDEEEEEDEPVSPEPILVEEPADEGHDGSYSPELLHGDDQNDDAVDPEVGRAILEKGRVSFLEEKQRRIQEAMANSRPAPSEDNLEMRVALKAMGAMEEGDAVFGNSDEVDLDSQVYRWQDKYRPRKPKYFNRVHTGYKWNKYNQTHYEHDNPPPKFVHGYKFNIFYPDLVDKIKAPVYTVEKDGDAAETCLIRFHAGPPYEDIAFRIVNKEWEYSHKNGFKCTFERGILHVYFNFKRHRYRR